MRAAQASAVGGPRRLLGRCRASAASLSLTAPQLQATVVSKALRPDLASTTSSGAGPLRHHHAANGHRAMAQDGGYVHLCAELGFSQCWDGPAGHNAGGWWAIPLWPLLQTPSAIAIRCGIAPVWTSAQCA